MIDFENGGSESFINTPEPTTIGLFSLGILAILRKRKK
ncbi:MAG: PEP-CTERM sorting domain-containing protein [Planctomycetota bacterium]